MNNYLNENVNDEEKKKKQLQTSTGSSTVIQGGAGGSQSATAPAAPLEKKANTQGTGFINMADYLAKNKAEGAGMTGALMTNVKADSDKTSKPITEKATANLEEGERSGFAVDSNFFDDPSQIDPELFKRYYNYDFDPNKFETPNFEQGGKDFEKMLTDASSNAYTGQKLTEQYGKGRLYSGMGAGLDAAVVNTAGDFRKGATDTLTSGKNALTELGNTYNKKMSAGGEYDLRADQDRAKFQTQSGEAYDKFVSDATKGFQDNTQYETYTPKEYSTRSDFEKAESERKAIDARNKLKWEASERARLAWEKENPALVNKANALGKLLGKGEVKVDYSKFGTKPIPTTSANTYKEIPVSTNDQTTTGGGTSNTTQTVTTAGQKAGQTVKKPIDVGVTDIKKVMSGKLPDTVPNMLKPQIYSGGGSGERKFSEGDRAYYKKQGYTDAQIDKMEQSYINKYATRNVNSSGPDWGG